MGILVDNLPVFESSGLGFIRITDQIDGLGHLRGIDKTPLCPRRETRTSSSTELTLFYLFPNSSCPHSQPLFQHLVSPVFLITGDIPRISWGINMFENQSMLRNRHRNSQQQPAKRSEARFSSTFS